MKTTGTQGFKERKLIDREVRTDLYGDNALYIYDAAMKSIWDRRNFVRTMDPIEQSSPKLFPR